MSKGLNKFLEFPSYPAAWFTVNSQGKATTMTLYAIEDGHPVNVDHLPPATISYLLRAGAEILEVEDSEYRGDISDKSDKRGVGPWGR